MLPSDGGSGTTIWDSIRHQMGNYELTSFLIVLLRARQKRNKCGVCCTIIAGRCSGNRLLSLGEFPDN